jgi:uncharacterized protein with HEPN domain
MDDRLVAALFDVRQAVADISRYVGDKAKTDFERDDMLRAAVERKHLIIGEALTRIRKIDLIIFMKIREADKIVGFRNVLAHGYDMVDDDISWAIITDKLPILRNDIEALIHEINSPH